jgi:hypothetical protein
VVVIKQLDEGTKERPYPHAVIAGIERYPRKSHSVHGTRIPEQSQTIHQGQSSPENLIFLSKLLYIGGELLASVPNTVWHQAGWVGGVSEQ